LQQLYEKTYPALSNDFYKAEEWPRAEVISSLVRNDEVFLTLYRDLYFRHLYSRFAANIDLDDRFDSYENYCNLFNYVLNSDGPVPIDLPAVWISDIVDEFIWQFGAFAACKLCT
jgi:translation initiation factor 3 subunit L